MEKSVWEQVRERLDPMLLRPCLRPDVVVRELEPTAQGRSFMIKSPQAATYLRVSERERFLLTLMDGERTVKQIVLQYFAQYHSMAFTRVIQFVMLLHRNQFLASTPVLTYAIVRGLLRAPRGLRAKLNRVSEFLLKSEISISGMDPLVTRVHRAIGWIILSRPALVLYALVAVAGLAAFQLDQRAGNLPLARLLTGENGALVGLAFIIFTALCTLLHESAHALVCKAFGCEVHRGGFSMFFGFPAFFVDTTDIWLEKRWRRIAVSAAGPLADLVVGGACALAVMVLTPELAPVSLAFATITYVIVLFNLFPLLTMDGYYVLVDLLQMPSLRSRSFAFLRETLPSKLRQRERFTREESILAIFGLLAFGYSVFFGWRALNMWQRYLASFFADIAASGSWLFLPLAVLLIVAVVVPMVQKLVRQGQQATRLAGRGARALVHAAEHTRLHGREALLVQVPVLAQLPAPQLEAIAAALRPRRYRDGSTLIRQGEQGDRFFLIVRGAAEVEKATASERQAVFAAMTVEQVATLGPGDYFGELALLRREPRAATVRASADLETLELAASDFERLVLPTWQLKERMAGAAELHDALASLELFRELRPSEQDLLLSRLKDESFAAGEVVVRQDEPGERFYVIREGRAEVLRSEPGQPERRVAELDPGDFFGELALLFSSPRAATIRALEPLRAWSLDRTDFDDVLRRYLHLDDVFEVAGRERQAALDAAQPVPVA